MGTDPTGIKIEFDPTQQRMNGVTYHGSIPFNVPFISQIDGNLWQGGCTDTLILPKFFNHLVSLYPWERYKLKHELDSMLVVRMYDSEDTITKEMDEQIRAVVNWTYEASRTGKVLVHCQAGLNRSSLIAACVLIKDGYDNDAAIELLREKRSPACLCNKVFEDYVIGFDG